MPGLRQRRGDEAAGRDRGMSSSCHRLHSLFSTGRLTANEIADTAQAQVNDSTGPAPTDIKRIAGASATKLRKVQGGGVPLGTRNASRDVLRAMRPSSGSRLPPVEEVLVPLWDDRSAQQVERPVAILFPHDVLDHIAGDNPSQWCTFVEGQEALQRDLDTWARSLNVDVHDGHPVAAVGLWDDSAPFTTKDSLNLLVFSLLSGAETLSWWMVAISKRPVADAGAKPAVLGTGCCTFSRGA